MPHTPLPSLTVIVATTPSLGMGYFGSLPWPPFKPDLAFFARITKRSPPPPPLPRNNDKDNLSSHNLQTSPGQPIPTTSINALLMGRKTWDSIPPSRRPLGDRVNVIISRQPSALAAELERAGPGKSVGRDGKQHVLVAGSIEEGLQRLVQEYPPLPPPSHQHHHQAKSGDGERFGGGDGPLMGAVTEEGNREEQEGFSGPGRPSLGRVFVIGGAQIYARALELDNCERVLWTRLEREWDCDVWFPSGVFVDQRAEADVGPIGGEEERKRKGWGRRSDDELDAWCGESVAGKKQQQQQQQLDDEGLEWEVQMWGKVSSQPPG